MRQSEQKMSRKFCTSKRAENGKTHPEKPEKGKTGCVLGAGGDENGWGRVQPDEKTQCPNQREPQNHATQENRRKHWVFAGFVAGVEGLVLPAGSGAAPRWGAPSTDQGGSRDRRRSLCATGDQRPTARTAGGPAGAPCCQVFPHANEKVRYRRSDT